MERTILVAEDSPTQAEQLRLLLEGEGYRVDVVPNGRAGLVRVQTAPPDLVVSDVVMPEMDGYALCQAIKSEERTRRIPVVLLTERNTPTDVIKGLQHGADNFITKPFERDYLLERIRRIFENLDLRRQGHLDVAITLTAGGRQIVINADKQQIMELFFATLEDLVRVNSRLQQKTVALEAAQEELVRAERLAILGQLAAAVSQELRTPLSVIKNSAFYLKMVLPDDKTVRKHLQILEREVGTANRIVTGMLDFVQSAPPNRVATDLGALVRESLDQAAVPGVITVVLDVADDLADITVDREQVKLALDNLISNAVQAMPAGGVLTIEARRTDGGALLEVGDTGVGISAEDLDRIFEPLFTRRAGGIGLGLTIARSLAEANGGEISVASRLGQGSRFSLRFGASPAA